MNYILIYQSLNLISVIQIKQNTLILTFIIQSKQSMQQMQDPRATVIKNVSQDQIMLEQVIKQIPSIQQITFDILIDLFDQCPQIREQPQFMQAIFTKYALYEELVMWILEPIKMIQKRVKTKATLPEGDWKRKYPFTSMRIVKQNTSFYIHLYLKTYFELSALTIWFQFLKEPNAESFYTSLGYFTEIMLPFIKYQFSDSTKICETLSDQCDDEFLMSSSEIVRQQTSVGKEREYRSNEKKRTYLEQRISILRIFNDELISFIFQFIEHEAVFKFIHNLILVSLQESDLKRSKRIFETFLKISIQSTVASFQDGRLNLAAIEKGPTMDICNEYILQILNEIYENANTEKNYRVIFFIDSIIRVNVIQVFIERTQHSSLMAKQLPEDRLTSSVDFSAIMAEQEILEYYLKSLTIFVKIYAKMVKNRKTEEEAVRQSKYISDDPSEQQNNGQGKVIKQFALQIDSIFKKLPELLYLVKKAQPRTVLFSSGQNIKPITLCKYELFQLIYNCLVLSREFPDSFVVDTEKINIFSIVEKYLKQNRWNNLAHQILEKIACLLIKSNKKFFRTKEMNKNNIADQFLNSIIQSFTNRKHIFLNSLRFTNQGNLHTLYTIAKAIINELKQSHKLANFVHELDYYKKFVMNDLQQYQTKIKQNKYPVDDQQLRKSESLNQDDEIKLYVDELSVREIVKKIDVVSKWPLKQGKRKHGSFIHRSLSYVSDQHQPHSMILSAAQKKQKGNYLPSQTLLNIQDQDDSGQQITKDYFLQKFSNTPGNSRLFAKSQVKSFSKTFDSNTPFFTKAIKKVQSISIEQPTLITKNSCSGYGLYTHQEQTSPQSRQSPIIMSYKVPSNGEQQRQQQQPIKIYVHESPQQLKKHISNEEYSQNSQCQSLSLSEVSKKGSVEEVKIQ